MYAASNERLTHSYASMLGMVALPVVVGLVSSALTSDAMLQFGALNQPPLSPPAWLFPIAWTVLYVLMGIASYVIYIQPAEVESARKLRTKALVIYGIQLAINFSWSLVFFGIKQYWVAFGLLMVMWALIIALVVMAFRIRRSAGFMLVPYLLWTTFAAYLNLMIALMN